MTDNEKPDNEIFQASTDEYNPFGDKCPNCGARGILNSYGNYTRYLVSPVNGRQNTDRIKPLRFKCPGCRTTHALLPEILVPYSPYSLRFILTVLIAYFERETPVAEVCKHYCIAISTLYRWKHRLEAQKQLILGVLIDKRESASKFIHKLLGEPDKLSFTLETFFGRYGFSFMQRAAAAATRISPA
jgi:hypothetical protein